MKKWSGIRPVRVVLMPLLLLASLVLLGACAAKPEAPQTAMSDARDAITRAEQADARQFASGELNEARGKIKLAEDAIAQENMEKAKQLAQEAEVMAKLAMAKTESAKAALVNQEMERAAKALTEEMDRMGGTK
ncbi:MAG: DUF4398 domain-containing protein [Marinospirillum sp.]|uniref:DUF4398 domain-containing protein n=1 Tax=Marinospirillum sp. TaxID=2183934 RepID=UPI0019FF181A|nr:DUF4398 domain-containing protein [Marinospirillum sp.]MBE0507703.1 DUF4398 domain-containing protein [Marinospirillum sp.]